MQLINATAGARFFHERNFLENAHVGGVRDASRRFSLYQQSTPYCRLSRISSTSVVIAFRFYFFLRGRAPNIIVRVFFIQRWRSHAICSTTSIASCFFFMCTRTYAIEDKRFVCVRKITLFSVTVLTIARVLNNNGGRDLFWFDATAVKNYTRVHVAQSTSVLFGPNY